ncbi:MAG: hypothetical protein M3M94_01615 [Actinomycetota bacterium]|nr:hypothetical protein [Actinomycetota bacterium]
MLRRLRVLTEVECYLRCYGAGEGNVRLLHARRRREPPLLGEELRRSFETRLDQREVDVAREPEAA